jgi:flagellar biosynthesis protein FlhF
MRIKRYVCADVRQAIRQIREELGPQAVILSNRKVEGGVEIAAAIDYDEAWAEAASPGPSGPPDGSREAQRASEGARHLDDDWMEPGASLASPSLAAVEQELTELRGLLERQLSSLVFGDLARRHPLRASVFRKLIDLGLSHRFAHAICAEIPPDIRDPRAAWRRGLGVLAHRIRIAEEDILTDGGTIALVGSTGVGKTTTVAKLAARFALRHGARHVALVTTDSYRVGAHEQLRAFAQILGIGVRVANDLRELRVATEYYADRKLVLVDTAGMSQRDVRFAQQVNMVQEGSPLARCYLVLSATQQLSALEEAVHAFSGARIDGCIITKIDEATGLGAVLSVAVEHRIPIAFLTNGQRVPEDVSSPRAHWLVARAVELARASTRRAEEEWPEMAYGG